MSSIVLSGDTSGQVSLTVPAIAGSNTVTIPAGTGTAAVQGVSTNIVSGTAVASTSGTAILFTGIPSWAKRITLMFQGVATSGTSNLRIQVGSGSVTNSGYVGSYFQSLSSAPNTAAFTAAFELISDASVGKNGALRINLQTGNTWVAEGSFGCSTGRTMFLGGSIALSGSLDRINVTAANGTDTFNAGSINILYE